MNNLTAPALAFCALGYGLITRARNAFYDSGVLHSYTSALPVISVGNLTAGGNSKTPLCIYLAKGMLARGAKPVILCRGYGGSVKGPVLVTAGRTAKEVGDEPLMMAQDYGLTVVVARDRVDGARFIEEGKLGNLIILDDGFQHRALSRALDILSVNVADEKAIQSFLHGRILPWGRFRENREAGLKRAHVIVFAERRPAKSPEIDPRLLAGLPPTIKAYRSIVVPQGLFDKDGKRYLGHEVVAFSGIANPEGFLETLAHLRLKIMGTEIFPDHHPFSEKNIDDLRAKYPDLALVCTEKDAIKLTRYNCHGIYALKTQLEVHPADAIFGDVERAMRP